MAIGELGPIAVGYNGTPGSLRAVQWAAREAAWRNRALQLVHAFSVPLAELTRVHIPAQTIELEPLRRSAERAVDAVVDQTTQIWPDLRIETVVRIGHPATVLQAAAEQAHMLVLGPARHGWPHRTMLGSTAAELMRTAPVPVALAGAAGDEGTATTGQVVVGADGTRSSEHAIGFAFDYASRHDVDLLAVLAWDELPNDAMPPSGGWMHLDWGDVLRACQRELAESLAGWRDQYPDVTVHPQVTTAELPTEFLLRLSAEADLLIVGRHSRAAVRHALIGSTSDAVAHYASCPVALVR